jgi:lipopolysaccharide transport system ATP-binding protein
MASIRLDDCSLHLPIYGTINRSLKGTVMATATGGRIAPASRHVSVVEALSEVSLHLRAGDRLGVRGHNGAGKTSLLRLIAGIYEPTAGQIRVEGRVSSFINLGMGMDMEATGRENILLCGLMFGLGFDEIQALTPAIGEFSGLGEFLDMPVRTYSSGMSMRLVFSIVTSVHPEILVMDEWMAVGDSDFAAQSEQRLRTLVDQAAILVLASHSEPVIKRLCNRVLTLEHGRVVGLDRIGE